MGHRGLDTTTNVTRVGCIHRPELRRRLVSSNENVLLGRRKSRPWWRAAVEATYCQLVGLFIVMTAMSEAQLCRIRLAPSLNTWRLNQQYEQREASKRSPPNKGEVALLLIAVLRNASLNNTQKFQKQSTREAIAQDTVRHQALRS